MSKSFRNIEGTTRRPNDDVPRSSGASRGGRRVAGMAAVVIISAGVFLGLATSAVANPSASNGSSSNTVVTQKFWWKLPQGGNKQNVTWPQTPSGPAPSCTPTGTESWQWDVYKYYGKYVVLVDSLRAGSLQYTGQDGDVLADGSWGTAYDVVTPPKCASVTPVAPTFTTPDCTSTTYRTITPPTQVGVIWSPSGSVTLKVGESVTYTASPAEGYVFPKAAQTSWSYSDNFDNTKCVSTPVTSPSATPTPTITVTTPSTPTTPPASSAPVIVAPPAPKPTKKVTKPVVKTSPTTTVVVPVITFAPKPQGPAAETGATIVTRNSESADALEDVAIYAMIAAAIAGVAPVRRYVAARKG